ncbi:MAG: alanine--tRNA ligase, partial [Chloroflexota bacterium]
MTSDEVRASFLNFFASKGHLIVPSSSLIPRGDPTLLLTTAGMVQFKPYYLGAAVPPSRRLTSCQKCFRTTDIESVGDPSHLTFFEMLGNFSIGDYFKREAIQWAWEFVTRQLKPPPERLRATIYLDDEEAFGYWQGLGIPGPEIIRLGEKDNFWGPAGSSGPCGPCSEIHFDFGADFGCQRPGCAPGCPCGRFLEIWNLVFVQYNQDESGRRTPIPRPSIDTGMGLERVTAAVNGQTSVYQTDAFQSLLARVSELTGKEYGKSEETDRAMRVVAEHGRGITFLIDDGVLPSNEGRGYVLRRLLRRASLFGRRLGLETFLTEVAHVTIERLGQVYPELVQRRDFILKTIEMEEARFSEALTSGLELLEEIIAEVTSRKEEQIPGKEAFRLYDTYGFPVELTREVAASRGLSVDLEGFQREMESQRERARAAHKFGTADTAGAGLAERLNVRETPFVGYDTLEHQSVIIDFLVDHRTQEMVSEG